MNDVPFIKQEEPNECGVAALTSIARYKYFLLILHYLRTFKTIS